MDVIKNWEKTKKRFERMWDNEIYDRCCVCVEAPLDAAHPYIEHVPEDPRELKKWYLDPDWILERSLESISKTYYAGDAVPKVFPYFGTGGHSKYLCDESSIEYTRDSIWVHPTIDDYDKFNFKMDAFNGVFLRELKAIEYLAKEGMGKFMIGPPDNCGSFDALSQLRGNVNLLMDTFDKPSKILKANLALVDILIETGDQIFDVIRENNDGGSIHSWMSTWSPKRHLQLQCDASVMMSNEDFKRFIMPELIKSANWLDHAIYHLDGMEQIRHIDSLLSIESINMIQWTPVAGQPPVTTFIPELKKIQKAGKGLVLIVTKNEIEPLLNELSQNGMLLNVIDAKDKEEADDIVRYVENF